MTITTAIKSKSAFFKEANGKRITRTQVGGLTLDDWDDFTQDAIKQLKAQGCPDEQIKLDDTGLSFGIQFISKPTTKRSIEGSLNEHGDFVLFKYKADNGETRSTRFNKKDAELHNDDDGVRLVVKVNNNTSIVYEIKP
jgi:hypothetical protein